MLNFGTNILNLWKFHVDWAHPYQYAPLLAPDYIPVAAFNEACNGGARASRSPRTNQSSTLSATA